MRYEPYGYCFRDSRCKIKLYMQAYCVAAGYYVSNAYISQVDLEVAHGVSTGKYTVGLGQSAIGLAGACCDAASIAMNALDDLKKRLESSGVDYQRILKNLVHLEVGTESNHDRSKSIKSILAGHLGLGTCNTSGADSVNACIGGTVAVSNAINTLRSKADIMYNKKKQANNGSVSDDELLCAIVVCTDIAIYSNRAEVPTSGMGAVALLFEISTGHSLPVIPVIENKANNHNNSDTDVLCEKKSKLVQCRGLKIEDFQWHWQNVDDFYKPHLLSESPVVQGKYSIECYLDSVLATMAPSGNIDPEMQLSFNNESAAFLFHCPYAKITQKALTKLFASSASGEAIVHNRFAKVTGNFQNFSRFIGNSYTASLWFSAIEFAIQNEFGKAYCFSYGSGLGAAYFQIQLITGDNLCLFPTNDERTNILQQRNKLCYEQMLEAMAERKLLSVYRLANDPEIIAHADLGKQLVAAMGLSVDRINENFKPKNVEMYIRPGEWYLAEIAQNGSRAYKKLE